MWQENQDRTVRWIRGSVPDGEEAAAVACAVYRCGLSTYGEVARHVAEHLFRYDHARAGWLGEVGLVYPWYVLHACQVLERFDGTLVQIDLREADRPRDRPVPMTTFFVAVLLTSVGAGTVGAVLGLGGGILFVPILTMFFGVDLHYAMGASIISVIATSSGAAAAYLRTGLSNVRIGFFLVMATISGALTGALLLNVVPVRWLELILGLALSYSVVATIQQINVELPRGVPHDWVAMRFGLEGVYYDRRLGEEVKYRATHVGRGVAAMYGAGVLSGLLGIGSGAFKVLAMDTFMRLPMKVSTATSNFMIGITAAASAGIYFTRGDIHPLIVAPVVVGVLVGAYLGSAVMARMRNTTVRKVFLPVVIYLALSMVLRGLGIHLL